MNYPLLALEWSGSIIAIIGSIFLSLKFNRLSLIIPWICWIVAPLLLIVFFSITKQNGLLFGQVLGLVISFLGLYQWISKEQEKTNLSQGLMLSSILFIAFGLFKLFQNLPELSITNFEWFGANMSIAASILMASRSKHSPLAWFLWIIGNSTMSCTSFINEQYGIMLTQVVFTLSSLLGAYTWIFKKESK